jgi:hypothetical protein
MDVNPAIVLAAVFVGAAIWGPLGALIGIPLAAAEYRSSRPTGGLTISSRRPPRMWVMPTKVNLIPDPSRYPDTLRRILKFHSHDITDTRS